MQSHSEFTATCFIHIINPTIKATQTWGPFQSPQKSSPLPQMMMQEPVFCTNPSLFSCYYVQSFFLVFFGLHVVPTVILDIFLNPCPLLMNIKMSGLQMFSYTLPGTCPPFQNEHLRFWAPRKPRSQLQPWVSQVEGAEGLISWGCRAVHKWEKRLLRVSR